MTDTAIKVEHFSKRYRLGQYVGSGAQYKTLRESLTNAVSAPLRRLRSNSQSAIHDSKSDTPQSNRFIWALKDVSFEVKQGGARLSSEPAQGSSISSSSMNTWAGAMRSE